MDEVHSVADWMRLRSIDLPALVAATGLEARVVAALVEGRYTPSPAQRRCVAAALAVDADHVAWGHRTEVEHLYGHGPQFGRTP